MYEKIKEEYKKLHQRFLETHPLLLEYTQEGVWAPSTPKQLFKIFKKIADNQKVFLDLGSGDGIAVMVASLFFKHAYGVESDRNLYELSMKMKEKLGIGNATFILDDFQNISFKKYDIMFIYPDNEFTLKLENKLRRELRGKLIVWSSIFRPKTLRIEKLLKTNYGEVCIYTKTPMNERASLISISST